MGKEDQYNLIDITPKWIHRDRILKFLSMSWKRQTREYIYLKVVERNSSYFKERVDIKFLFLWTINRPSICVVISVPYALLMAAGTIELFLWINIENV